MIRKASSSNVIKEIKEVRRGRIKEYVDAVPTATYHEAAAVSGRSPCDIDLPSATQNEIDGASAELLVKNGCFCVAEGANMPSTPEAIAVYQKAGVLYAPAKAANAGGVGHSGDVPELMRYSWTFEEVDAKTRRKLWKAFSMPATMPQGYGEEGDLMAGANIAGFLKVCGTPCWRRVLHTERQPSHRQNYRNRNRPRIGTEPGLVMNCRSSSTADCTCSLKICQASGLDVVRGHSLPVTS